MKLNLRDDWKRLGSARRGLSDAGVVLVLILLLLGITGWVYWQWRQKHPRAPLVAPATQTVEGSETRGGKSAGDAEAGEAVERGLVYGGEPRVVGDGGGKVQILKNIGYEVGYSNARRDPLWVGYRLFRLASPRVTMPRPSGFSVDPRTTAQVSSREYTDSQFDRGHMAPNHAIAQHYGAKAQLETFLMSNIVPQRHVLNAGVWEVLERKEDSEYAQKFEEIWVLDGPLFAEKPAEIGSGVQVPKGFYKILVREENVGGRRRPRMLAFVFPQPAGLKDASVGQQADPADFRSTVRAVEQESKLDFFWQLDRGTQEAVETERAGMW